MDTLDKSHYINAHQDYYEERLQGDFLIPKGLCRKDVMNLSNIISNSIFSIEQYLNRFEVINPNELLQEEMQRYESLKKVLEDERQELQLLKELYQEHFI